MSHKNWFREGQYMSNIQNNPNDKLLALLRKIAEEGISHAMDGLSQMVGQQLKASPPDVSLIDLMEIPSLIGGPETEAVGIYLLAEGQMSGQFMLILTREKAMEMVDLLMDEKPGSCQELDNMGRSALAEMGNLSGAFFLNTIASLTGLESKPSPPAVMFDMAGAIMNVIVATSAQSVDQVVMILTRITLQNREVDANFLYIPDPRAMEELAKKAG
jgi:chemotaxis protein CheC